MCKEVLLHPQGKKKKAVVSLKGGRRRKRKGGVYKSKKGYEAKTKDTDGNTKAGNKLRGRKPDT